MLRGIERYRSHPYRRTDSTPDALWREGTSTLLDYRVYLKGPARRPPVVLVPSLVNRAYILDLRPEQSLARYLADRGHPVFLMDWDAPGETERSFDVGDYIARLRRALAATAREMGEPVGLVGYCMGGLLALAAAIGIPDTARSLTLMATPWDFHAERPEQARALAAQLPGWEPMLAQHSELPTDVLQALFTALDPLLAFRKFAWFDKLNPDSDAAKAFVALEDWLNDGVPLSAPVARDCIRGWYGENRPGRGIWIVDGLPVDPAAWTKPTLALIPAGDRIVPPGSALALAGAVPDCRIETPSIGHIGMIVAGNARRAVWEPLTEFLDSW
ncbi:alpha/beta fold hydrolase [Pacificispira spongiicola]|nr:alpha/beta fold hydrolase [Pacificispira spongiicola]